MNLFIFACFVYFGIGLWAGWLWRGLRETKTKRELLRKAQAALLNLLAERR